MMRTALAYAVPDAIEDGVEELLATGAVILRGVADPATVAKIDDDLTATFEQTALSQGLFYGGSTVRFGKLLSRAPGTQALVLDPTVFGIVQQVLGRWHSQLTLSFTQAIGIRSGGEPQVPHRDEEMWPVIRGEAEYLINVIWPLTRFTEANGGTMLWRGSHRQPGNTGALPAGTLDYAEMEPGDALVFLGSTLHAGGRNVTPTERRGMVMGYSPAWLLPSENQMLSYPPEVARTFPRELTELIGYRRVRPNLNNLDCRCPSELLYGGETGGATTLGAVDDLHPVQVDRLEKFYDSINASEIVDAGGGTR